MGSQLRIALAAICLTGLSVPVRADVITFSFEPDDFVSGSEFLDTPTTFRPTVGPADFTITVRNPTEAWFWSPAELGSDLIYSGSLSSAPLLVSFSATVSRLLIDYELISSVDSAGLSVGNEFYPLESISGRDLLDIPVDGNQFAIEGRDGPPNSENDRSANFLRIISISVELSSTPPAVIPAPPGVILAGLGVAGLALKRRVMKGRA